jgi:hypothetical protein
MPELRTQVILSHALFRTPDNRQGREKISGTRKNSCMVAAHWARIALFAACFPVPIWWHASCVALATGAATPAAFMQETST